MRTGAHPNKLIENQEMKNMNRQTFAASLRAAAKTSYNKNGVSKNYFGKLSNVSFLSGKRYK